MWSIRRATVAGALALGLIGAGAQGAGAASASGVGAGGGSGSSSAVVSAAAPAPSSGGVTQFAGSVSVPAGTTLQGGVSMMTGQVNVDGTLAGSVTLSVGQVEVGPQGIVQGAVSVGVGQVTVRPGGRIDGAVSAGGSTAQSLHCPSTAASDCTLVGVGGGWSPGGFGRHPSVRGVWGVVASRFLHWPRWVGPTVHVLGWLGRLALALPVAALFPAALGRVTRRMEVDPWRSLLVGLAALVLALPVLVVVSITIIGIPVALAAALALVAAWFFGYVGVATLVGDRTLRLGGVAGPNPLLALLVGSALILVAGWVPLLGGVVGVAVACLGVGSVLLTRFGTGSTWPGGGAGGGGRGPAVGTGTGSLPGQ